VGLGGLYIALLQSKLLRPLIQSVPHNCKFARKGAPWCALMHGMSVPMYGV
jgi:hypothetical protein